MTFAFLFFDSVGGGEWLVLLAVILIVVGPKNLPSAARKVGQIMSQLRRAADEFKRQIMTMDQEMEKVVNDVKKDYIDVADDVNRTVTEETSSETASTDEAAPTAPGSEMSDGEDRAYDYYGEENYGYDETGEGYSDEGPAMAEHAPETPVAAAETPAAKPVPTEAELKAIHITVSTAASRGEKA